MSLNHSFHFLKKRIRRVGSIENNLKDIVKKINSPHGHFETVTHFYARTSVSDQFYQLWCITYSLGPIKVITNVVTTRQGHARLR